MRPAQSDASAIESTKLIYSQHFDLCEYDNKRSVDCEAKIENIKSQNSVSDQTPVLVKTPNNTLAKYSLEPRLRSGASFLQSIRSSLWRQY
jgi:hypothetical protein